MLTATTVIFLCLCLELSGAEPVRPVSLRCEYLIDPAGIDVTEPRLSWRIGSEAAGGKQTAYRVLVATSREKLAEGDGDLWDSGKVESDQSIHVAYAGKPLVSRSECHWKVRIWFTHHGLGSGKHGKPSAWSKPSRWTMGLLDPGDWTAQWISAPAAPVRNGTPGTARAEDSEMPGLFGASGKAAPWIRKEFDFAVAPDSAWITVHSPGYFELYLNGAKVGEDVLTPAVSNLEHQSFTVTYDAGRHLRPGRNCIGLWLGEGWAEGIAVRAQLDAVVGGEPVTIGTETSWKTRRSGYYRIGGRKWNDFGGERIDAREAVPGWSLPGLDTASWTPAIPAEAPGGAVRTQPCPLNRIGREIPAVAVTALDGGVYEIDFGTALTGWLRLKMPALRRGATVKMTFADVRREEKYQHFNQVSEFISAGNPGEVFENKFNYAGFRYVLVEGLPSALTKEDATALLVESDLEEAGSFECSNDLFNRIHSVNQWTQRSLNLGGYYVDCPHRERMGYGDGQVAAEGFMTSFRADGFYRKWLRDWRLRQDPDGKLPHMAPFGSGGGGPGWGGLLSAVAWRHYLYYGDRRVLEENYDAVRRYVNYLESLCKDGVLRRFGGKWDFIGDWVPPRRGMDTSNWPGADAAELFNNCYRINQWEVLEKMATALGKLDEAERCRKRLAEIRPLVHAAFYDGTNQQYVIDEQAYHVMPLMTGIVPESECAAILKKLERNILEKNQGHLDTGMLGTYFMMEYLREIGRSDLVFTMFNQTTYPGWGHMLAEGATTLWEQWNGHWSRIHSCFTSPDNWLYQGAAGIQADPAAPGFEHVIIKPSMVGDLIWVNARHDSPYGRIVSNWKREDDRVTMEVTIPANSTATIYVPARVAGDVTVNGRALAKADHVTFLRMEEKSAVIGVGAGSYVLISTRNQDEPKRTPKAAR